MEFRVSINGLDAFAKRFWKEVRQAKVFAFHGEMGAGKTTMVAALCHVKGVTGTMGSPTFSIINEYSFNENSEQKKIYHIDLYRLKDEEEVVQAGVEDCVYGGSICMIEWPEKAPALFGEETVHIFIRTISETERMVDVKMPALL
jgi:tRNA threonylcarbamoyladenosine biosynthesis protein TsaE